MGWIHMGDLWQERGGRTVNRRAQGALGTSHRVCAQAGPPGTDQIQRRLEALGACMRVKGRSLEREGLASAVRTWKKQYSNHM